jgi:predicted DNA binding protein
MEREAAESASELTPVEHEVLVRALDTGYFAVPRRISTAELATESGLSPQKTRVVVRQATHKLLIRLFDGQGESADLYL